MIYIFFSKYAQSKGIYPLHPLPTNNTTTGILIFNKLDLENLAKDRKFILCYPLPILCRLIINKLQNCHYVFYVKSIT